MVRQGGDTQPVITLPSPMGPATGLPRYPFRLTTPALVSQNASGVMMLRKGSAVA